MEPSSTVWLAPEASTAVTKLARRVTHYPHSPPSHRHITSNTSGAQPLQFCGFTVTPLTPVPVSPGLVLGAEAPPVRPATRPCRFHSSSDSPRSPAGRIYTTSPAHHAYVSPFLATFWRLPMNNLRNSFHLSTLTPTSSVYSKHIHN